MSFQQSIHVNLQDEKLIKFVINHDVKQGMPVQPQSPPGFSIKANREVGKSRSAVYWSRYINCAIYRGRARPTVLARQEIMCLANKPVIIELTAFLQTDDNDAAYAPMIIDSFNSFDPAKHGDPNDYISDSLKANPAITRKMFRVDLGYTVWIDGKVIMDDLPLQRFLDFWEGKFPGTVVVTRPTPGGPNESESIGEVLEKNEMWANVLGVPRDVYAVVPYVPNPDKIETSDPQNTAEERAREELQQADCVHITTETHEVAQLLNWFETKVDWKEIRIDLGCGNWMSLYVPAFQTREVAYFLYASVTTPDSSDANVKRAVMNCFWTSALAGSVVLIALSDSKTALVAFKALFLECIVRKFEQALTCVAVDLFIGTRVLNDWH
ncbi:hypothetical protein ACC684_28675 [Rhizobium ruizarguesonis]